ncbi:hypothetical protein [Phytohabitans rumicis]|uniref:Uncharacterized protein n=1 Tax=Phytohabitans rumicis TaxID=1076125 RepID=A0A6V8LSC7_9ACTN|nr:hypothetical protein [Phytohabitans rumicis]GFJ95655.1 hypothetical protein Prum_092970 [Phytohabitans rumicis]
MRHRRPERKRWEKVTEALAVAMLAIPAALIAFAGDWLWGDEWATVLLLGAFAVPPFAALWLLRRVSAARSRSR